MKQPLVIKIGGALLEHQEYLKNTFKVLAQLQSDHQLVLVHGGGGTVQDLLQKLGFSSEKIDGVRITPEQHIPYVVGALAGTVNTLLCAHAFGESLSPVGLTLIDGGICKAQQLSEQLGAVGKVEGDEPALLKSLVEQGHLPIISSIACDESGQLLNVNADDAAAAVAQLLSANLVLLSDVAGVLNNEGHLISELSPGGINTLVNDGTIAGGMVVKVQSALQTATATGQSVFIAGWKDISGLLQFQGQGIGTRITSHLSTECSMKEEA